MNNYCSKFLTSFDEIMIMKPCEKETQFRGKSEFTYNTVHALTLLATITQNFDKKRQRKAVRRVTSTVKSPNLFL